MRSLAALSFVVLLLGASSARAQDDVERRRHVLELREELDGISLEGPDFAEGFGLQLVFYACVATTVGSVMEVFSQELSQRWRFDAPPWFAIGGAIAGFALALIGVPTLAAGAIEGGRRERRRRAIEAEIAEHEAALGVTVTPTPAGLTLALSGTF